MAEKEYIEREAAIAVIYGQHVGGKEACENARPNTYGADLREIVADIEDIPAADVRPVVHGHWIGTKEAEEMGDIMKEFTCSVCGCCEWDCTESESFNFCPNCGADMRELQNG
jgi:hypothetical protein